jgi:uncharacterized membrane protein YecN with MAPEG domain
MITAALASVLALLYLYLAARTILLRRQKNVPLGTGGDAELEKAIRAHANFAEYVPLALLLILMLELQNASRLLISFLGLLLVSGRSIHAYGVSQASEDFRLRVAGMSMTLACLALSAIANLLYFLIYG